MYDNFDPDELGYDYELRAHRFRDPNGQSALHPGARTHSCPTCKRPNMLTSRDVVKGYQCDYCADAAEGCC
jgi:hypothetical protein